MKISHISVSIAFISALILLLTAACNQNGYTRSNNPVSTASPSQTNITVKTPAASYRFPAEFENQQAIWLQWPTEAYDEEERPVSPTMVTIAKAFAQYIRVNIAVRSSGEIAHIGNLLKKSGYTGTNINYYVIDHMSIWTRDIGPIFVKDKQNKLNIVDFRFNNYSRDGSRDYIDTENNVNNQIAGLYNFPLISTSLISEGGAIESNGKGTLMLTEAVALKRNPGMTIQRIEDEYKRVLGVSKIIWLKKGLAEDDNITGGHINEIARFASANTILLGQILPGDRDASDLAKESYQRLEENYDILKNSTDQDGKPFTIIRVPMPPTLYNVTDSAGRLPVRSYMNYAVTNGAVLLQTYWRAGRSDALKAAEDEVKDLFRRVFPGREIIGIDAENINLWGGGIHCISQHMPAD